MRPKLITGGHVPRGLAGGAGTKGPAIRVKEATMISERLVQQIGGEVLRRRTFLRDGMTVEDAAENARACAEDGGRNGRRASLIMAAAWTVIAIELLDAVDAAPATQP